VLEVNDALRQAPELLNGDAFGEGWIARLELTDAGELDDLLDAAAYREQTAAG